MTSSGFLRLLDIISSSAASSHWSVTAGSSPSCNDGPIRQQAIWLCLSDTGASQTRRLRRRRWCKCFLCLRSGTNSWKRLRTESIFSSVDKRCLHALWSLTFDPWPICWSSRFLHFPSVIEPNSDDAFTDCMLMTQLTWRSGTWSETELLGPGLSNLLHLKARSTVLSVNGWFGVTKNKTKPRWCQFIQQKFKN